MASELVARGWRLVADDTTRLTWDGANASAWPSRDTIKLWKDICDRKEIDVSGLERVTNALDKYYLPVEGVRSPQTLGAIVELVPDAEGAVTSLPERMSLVTRQHLSPALCHAAGDGEGPYPRGDEHRLRRCGSTSCAGAAT